MDKKTALLLAEAKVYKEEMKRSQFMLSQFCERLRLTENDELTAQADSIQESLQAFEKIGAVLENAACELEKVPEAEEIITEVPVTEMLEEVIAEAPVSEVAEEAVTEAPVFEVAEEVISDAPAFDAAEEIVNDAPAFGFAEEAACDTPAFAPAFDFVDDSMTFAPAADVVSEPASEEPVFGFAEVLNENISVFEEAAPSASDIPPVPAEDNVARCESCGNIVKDTYVFCSVCGTRVKKEEKPAPERSFSDFLKEDPALSIRVFPDFNEVEEEDIFDVNDFMPSIEEEPSEAPVNEPAVNTARPAAFLIRHADNSVIPLLKDEFYIGRDPAKTDFCITGNSAISRVHAKIYFINGQYFVADCDSVNGTYVNETRIMPADSFVLFNGSEIRLNVERFTFRIS